MRGRYLLTLCLIGLAASSAVYADYPPRPWSVTEERQPCDHYSAERQVFWGDTHVHTALSLDAAQWDTRNMPEDAYRFAKGERMGFPPYDDEGQPTRWHRLGQPLDFAMVSDHAEYLGYLEICRDPNHEKYSTRRCGWLRENPELTFLLSMAVPLITSELARRDTFIAPLFRWLNIKGAPQSICGRDHSRCREAGKIPWQRIQRAAEMAYDRSSACSFTSFVGYEWTGYTGANIHRNVLFRNKQVPEIAVSALDVPSALRLWQELELNCTHAGNGCQVLTIPHNSNVSVGQMFPLWGLADAHARGAAQLSARYERLVEIFQHKGDSECYYAPGSADELCAFEKLPYNTLGGRINSRVAKPVGPAAGFVRRTLSEGFRYRREFGINPYQFGLIASTDDHLAAPGMVAEKDYFGHSDAGSTLRRVLSVDTRFPDAAEFSPGGLAAIWAEENTRDSLYAAMQRREVYGSSGPRLQLRMFGGWEYPQNLCDAENFATVGYRDGVPMGGELSDRPGPAAVPRFAIRAAKDPSSAVALQRMQIVKGWIDDFGRPQQQVYEVAGDTASTADVDLLSCTPRGEGFNRLCAVWQDPDFDPAQSAWYYARVLQNPSCRWTTWFCNSRGVSCDNEQTYQDGLEDCCKPEYPKTIRERAWSSPIWYYPPEDLRPGPREQRSAVPPPSGSVTERIGYRSSLRQ